MRTESPLNHAIFTNVLGAFYRGWYVVVHLYSNFSIRRQMAPVQSIKFQNANFSDFLHTYYCDFLKNVYRYGSVFSCENGQYDAHPAGIAVTRSSHCFCF